MIFRILYTTEPKRILNAVIMDARFAIPALTGLGGFAVKAFVDAQIALAAPSNVLVYKIETLDGNMAAVFSLLITNIGLTATQHQLFVRPSFLAFNSEIIQNITTFITNGGWKPDYLT